MLVPVDTRERGEDVICGMCDEWRVLIREEHAVVLHEIEQVGHLREV